MGLNGCRNAKQVHGQSERIDRHPPNTLRQGQTTRLPGTCKNCLEGKATCLRKLVGLSFFFRYHSPLSTGCQLLYHDKLFRTFGMIQPASHEKIMCNLFSLFYAFKRIQCLRKDQHQRTKLPN